MEVCAFNNTLNLNVLDLFVITAPKTIIIISIFIRTQGTTTIDKISDNTKIKQNVHKIQRAVILR